MIKIKINSLRIGNWVRYNYNNSEEQITGMSSYIKCVTTDDSLLMGSNYGNTTIKQIHPIPLTPEVLKKCGLKSYNYKGNTYWSNKWFIFYIDRDGAIEVINVTPNSNKPKYLHELQNLYWCLTGRELKYKPTKISKS